MMYVVGFVALALVIGLLVIAGPPRTRPRRSNEVRCGDCGALLGHGEHSITAIRHECPR
jgi:hypothetical protein